uniref:Putative Cytochrome B561 family protein n=1 Tax=Magnetococcus massalia (strain MO-1) TaxID=451514 RepID=A0A1S7LM90_MAGMO|nr:putative Cytochrome B561 family protein [Candidatus Magnetococcus massalia]
MRTDTLTKVWDLPTRLFHWSLVLLVVVAFWSGKQSEMSWHLWSGYGLLSLLLFRLGWGLWGSETSRFSHFVHGPGVVIDYLKGVLKKEPQPHYGHNPAGALMIVALLLVLLVQGVTGLFSSENTFLFFDGPLAPLVGGEISESITFFHKKWGNLLLLLVPLHILANLLYLLILKENLFKPMLNGYTPADDRAGRYPYMLPTRRAIWTLLGAMALVALVMWGLPRLVG